MKKNVFVLIVIQFVLGLPAVLPADTEVEGELTGLMDREGSPYIAVGDVTVPDGESLRISPGVELKFNAGLGMFVYGKLEAMGAEGDSIRFTNNLDEERWRGVRFLDADSLSRLSYCVMAGGSAWLEGEGSDSLRSGGNLFISGDFVRVEHTRISDGRAQLLGGGVAVWRGNPVFDRCLFTGNYSASLGAAMGILNGGGARITKCRFEGNNAQEEGGGIYMAQHSEPVIEDSEFRLNRAGMGEYGVGGALAVHDGASPVVRNSRFERNSASVGGVAYNRGEGTNPLYEWCDFVENAADEDHAVGGAIYIREESGTEVRYCRFIRNEAQQWGGGLYVKEPPYCTVHHNLFMQNGSVRGGGAIATSDDLGERALSVTNCSFVDNVLLEGGEEEPVTADTRGESTILFSSCVIWDDNPMFEDWDEIFVSYSIARFGIAGEGNLDVDPRFFAMSGDWYMLSGDSPCIDTGDPNLPGDPDGTENDRGWLYYPHNIRDGLTSDLLSEDLDEGERSMQPLELTNIAEVPVMTTPMDMWQSGAREAMFNTTVRIQDSEIEAAIWTGESFLLAGGNNLDDPNKIYVIGRNFNFQAEYDQPGGVDGAGFLDFAYGGEGVIFAGDNEQIVEFSPEGELEEQYEGPDAIRVHRAIGADFRYTDYYFDFYIGGDEGLVIRTDDEFFEEERYTVGDTVRSLGVRWNSRAAYVATMPIPGLFLLSLLLPDEGRVEPLYYLNPPNRRVMLGGLEITEDWREGRGSMIGVWKSVEDGSDFVFIDDLYTSWLAVQPEWKLLMPGQRAEWEIVFAGDHVSPGRHASEFYLSVNGSGRDGSIPALLNVVSHNAVRNDSFAPRTTLLSVSPNPFNGIARLQFDLTKNSHVSLTMHDLMGRNVGTLIENILPAGSHQAVWDAHGLAGGVYIARLDAGGAILTRRVILGK